MADPDKFYFSIKEPWVVWLSLAAAAAWVFFAGAFYLMLPMALPDAPKAAASIFLGAGAAGLALFDKKSAHFRRHAAAAAALGLSCRTRRPLWNHFAPMELLLEKTAADPSGDGLAEELVRRSGCDYSRGARGRDRIGDAALASAVLLALLTTRWPGLLAAALPATGLAALVFLLRKWDLAAAFIERMTITAEGRPGTGKDYCRWNFLDLEAKRHIAGRVPAMERIFARVLLEEAGLTPGSRILEVGAAGGFLRKHIPPELRSGWVQAEKDPLALLYAEKLGGGASVVSADVKSLPFPDASFDAVVGLECFDSLTTADLEAFLPEAARVLKPGGRLVHLKDFPDWPGAALADAFNSFAGRAGRKEPLVRLSGASFRYTPLRPEEVRELSAAAAREKGADRHFADILVRIYSNGPGADARFSTPMFVSALVLSSFIKAAGFRVVRDSFNLPPGRESEAAYIVAAR